MRGIGGSRLRGMAPAAPGIFVALHRATFELCSFLSSLGKKETNQRKKPPAGQNLPVLRALFCSAVNAFAVRADSYSVICPGVPLTAARRKRAPSVCRAFRARHRQILHSRLYLPLLCFRCDCFCVFTNARHRAHGGATFMIFPMSFFTALWRYRLIPLRGMAPAAPIPFSRSAQSYI